MEGKYGREGGNEGRREGGKEGTRERGSVREDVARAGSVI
jgi:hypothetical protein